LKQSNFDPMGMTGGEKRHIEKKN